VKINAKLKVKGFCT